jgi:hypothetical protein
VQPGDGDPEFREPGLVPVRVSAAVALGGATAFASSQYWASWTGTGTW